MIFSFTLFDIIIGIVALISLFLIIKNMKVRNEFYIPIKFRPKISENKKFFELSFNGKKYLGITYISENLPRGGDDLPKRIIRLAKSSRLSVSFISNMYNVNKSTLLKLIDEEMKKADLSLSSTGQIKFRERLKYLEELYKEVARIGVPYIGNFGFIVWIDQNDRDSELSAEAFRSLVEAESQIKTKRINADEIDEMLSINNPISIVNDENSILVTSADDLGEYEGIIIGEEENDPGKIVIISYPENLKHHMGIFGPTGRGKTVLLSGIASQLSLLSSVTKSPDSIIVLDPKGDISDLLKRVSDNYIEPGLNDCIPFSRIEGLANKLIESSYLTGDGFKIKICEGQINYKGLTVYNLSRMPNEARNVYGSLIISSLALDASENKLNGIKVLILDEAWRFVKNSQTHLEFALREGRSKGLYLIYATQLPSDVGKEVIDNTGTKAVFGGFTKYYAELASQLGISDSEQVKTLPIGYILLKIENNKEKSVKVLDFSKLLLNRRR
ncbi:MAG: ATP-binding protein [Caldisphaera sp.]|jgi:hypothetical protein